MTTNHSSSIVLVINKRKSYYNKWVDMKPSLEKYAKDTFERENQFKKLEKLSSEK